MEQVAEIYKLLPDQLLNIQGIRLSQMELIGSILQFYEALDPSQPYDME